MNIIWWISMDFWSNSLIFLIFSLFSRSCIITNTGPLTIMLGVLKSYNPNSFISGNNPSTRPHYHIKNHRWSWSIFIKIRLHHPTSSLSSNWERALLNSSRSDLEGYHRWFCKSPGIFIVGYAKPQHRELRVLVLDQNISFLEHSRLVRIVY